MTRWLSFRKTVEDGPIADTGASDRDVECASDSEDPFMVQPDLDADEDDFVLLPGADALAPAQRSGRLRFLPIPVQDSVVQVGRRLGQAGSASAQVCNAAFTAAYETAMDQNPFSVSTYSPHLYLIPAALAAGLHYMSLRGDAGGAQNISFTSIIDEAEEYLEAARAGLSVEQVSIVQTWIADARARLRDYLSKNRPTLDDVMAPSDEAPEVSDTKEFPGRRLPQYPRRDAPKRVTVRSLMSQATRMTRSLNDQAALKEKDLQLAHVLGALQRVKSLPYKVQKTPLAKVNENFDNNPALGSRVFIESLRKRAQILAENAYRPTREQNKKVMLAASGPGTGKTTSIQKMLEWAEQPLGMLTGEQFCKLDIPKGKNAFDMLEAWVAACVLEQFRVSGGGVTNGVILLDDFHFALEGDGPFAKDNRARQCFFRFLKNLGDANQEGVLSVELSPGHVIPLNLGRVQIIITLNRVPPELGANAEAALLSRLVNLNPAYADAEDRNRMALDYLPTIRRAMAAHYNCKPDALTWINEATAQACLTEIAGVDIQMSEERFAGQLGIRGLIELLDQYKQHVLSKVAQGHAHHDPEVCAFDGPTPFDPRAAALNIHDYNKGLDQNMAKADQKKLTLQQIDGLRNDLDTLTKTETVAMKALLDIAQREADADKPSAEALANAQFRLQQYRNRVALTVPNAIGPKVREKFGYLRSGSEALTTGDVDRYGPVMQVMLDIYWRMVSVRSRDAKLLNNRAICVRLADPSADDAAFYTNLADIVGNPPVHHLEGPDSFLSEFESALGLEFSHPLYSTGQYKTSDHVNYRLTDYGDGNFRKLKLGDKYYFYARLKHNDGGAHTLLLPKSSEALEALMNSTGVQAQLNQRRFIVARDATRTEEEIVRQYAAPQWVFIENYLKHVEPMSALGEAFIVAHVNAATRALIDKWAALQPNSAKASPRDLFERALHRQLNAAEITLLDGRTFDPRALTLFFNR